MKVLSTKVVLFINSRKFSPSKVSCYMVITAKWHWLPSHTGWFSLFQWIAKWVKFKVSETHQSLNKLILMWYSIPWVLGQQSLLVFSTVSRWLQDHSSLQLPKTFQQYHQTTIVPGRWKMVIIITEATQLREEYFWQSHIVTLSIGYFNSVRQQQLPRLYTNTANKVHYIMCWGHNSVKGGDSIYAM